MLVMTAIIMTGVVLVLVVVIGGAMIVKGTIRPMEDAVLDRVTRVLGATTDIVSPSPVAGTGPVRTATAVPAASSVTAAAVMVVLGNGGAGGKSPWLPPEIGKRKVRDSAKGRDDPTFSH